MTANPTDLVYVDGVAVSKASVRSFDKTRVRQRMADPTEVRNTSLSGQFAGIYIRSLQGIFDLDTLDTTTPDDGTNCVVDFDGNRFKIVSVVVADTERTVTAAGSVTIVFDDADVILIKKTVGAPTSVYLPASSTRTKNIRIVDRKYDALTNNIAIFPYLAETVMGGASYIIDSNGASVELKPLADGTGWV